ncbi:MAG: RNA-directed DNA polymerase [Deltaproteobacteria bacterium]|nr:RNA-directed DNA polymerase [Deltaproteobacteria bacterium]
MIPEHLTPDLDLLKQEYVLVQAWKKTAAHIRKHNWFCDTVDLDRTTLNLEAFLAGLADELADPSGWTPRPLRIVPAPKSHAWEVSGTGLWSPAKRVRLRPLAHVSLRDQVTASALMLCLADRVETLQGDPRPPPGGWSAHNLPVSYGNRLYCDTAGGQLRHRWGSTRLYREYFQDYQTFLRRPDELAGQLQPRPDTRLAVLRTDLHSFFDRVRPALLLEKLRSLRQPNDDPRVFELAARVLAWQWDQRDQQEVTRYSRMEGLDDFSSVALPQGLVAAGFLSNVVLLDFDRAARDAIGLDVGAGVVIEDVSRYVDDLRIVVRATGTAADVEKATTSWLTRLLADTAPGLELKSDKTRVAFLDGDERPLVRQSRTMGRIQQAVSGGIDAQGGEEILDAVQGLLRAQERFPIEPAARGTWSLAPVADVPDATVARFAASRFRRAYRLLRPLLLSRQGSERDGAADGQRGPPSSGFRTRSDLDDELRAFALGLIERWVDDPSNVRLLRIGLDLWPDQKVLEAVLRLLQPFTGKSGRRGPARRVAWYCLSEVLRAGATETGYVRDDEMLPAAVDVAVFRRTLVTEANRVASLPGPAIPWYLRQQALLCIAVHGPSISTVARSGRAAETRDYRRLILLLRGELPALSSAELATMVALCRRSFPPAELAPRLSDAIREPAVIEAVASRDPELAREAALADPDLVSRLSPRVRDDLCLRRPGGEADWVSLADLVLAAPPDHALRSEPDILSLAAALMRGWPDDAEGRAITPNEIEIRKSKSGDAVLDTGTTVEARVASTRVAPLGSMYAPPQWCPPAERWRLQLGYLLRFVLSGNPDFTRRSEPAHRGGRIGYRPPWSCGFQRRYGLFNGQAAFGSTWLPISEWLEGFLAALLRWPGCHRSARFSWVGESRIDALDHVEARLAELQKLRRPNLMLLPFVAPDAKPLRAPRPLRACIVQTVIPEPEDFNEDLEQSTAAKRWRHRNHLSAALAAVERMLVLRDTHLEKHGRLDWLILPELSVHPDDVGTHLIPFARKHRAIVLAGLTYRRPFSESLLINSAVWVIPTLTDGGNLRIVIREQGKWHLAPAEQKLNRPTPRIRSFRPCQWLIGYEWSDRPEDRPLWLTAAVCYDASDLSLAAGLRDRSDVFAVPALNKDVKVFDQMALALHYHMYQLVVVVNNGGFGGSNAYWPKTKDFHRQVFHLHGQPQASIAFFEIDDIGKFIRRANDARASLSTGLESEWKFPPAGLEE